MKLHYINKHSHYKLEYMPFLKTLAVPSLYIQGRKCSDRFHRGKDSVQFETQCTLTCSMCVSISWEPPMPEGWLS